MSSLVRRMQIRIWKRQGKKPYNHNEQRGKVSWPLLSSSFTETK